MRKCAEQLPIDDNGSFGLYGGGKNEGRKGGGVRTLSCHLIVKVLSQFSHSGAILWSPRNYILLLVSSLFFRFPSRLYLMSEDLLPEEAISIVAAML